MYDLRQSQDFRVSDDYKNFEESLSDFIKEWKGLSHPHACDRVCSGSMSVCLYVCTCAYQGYMWDRVSPWTWRILIWINWLASKPWRCSCLCLPSSGPTGMCHYVWVLLHEKKKNWGLPKKTWICIARTLPTETFFQPLRWQSTLVCTMHLCTCSCMCMWSYMYVKWDHIQCLPQLLCTECLRLSLLLNLKFTHLAPLTSQQGSDSLAST